MDLDPITSLKAVARLRDETPDRRQSGMIDALHERMVGELTGDLDLIMSGIHNSFELMVGGGDTPAFDRAGFRDRMAQHCASDAVMWMEWNGLYVSEATISGHGCLRKISAATGLVAEGAGDFRMLQSRPCAVFLRFSDDRFVNERVFTDKAEEVVERVAVGVAPDRSAVIAQMGK